MKAIIQTGYGLPSSVLRLQEQERPVPNENEVLVKVHASSVNAMDWRLFSFPLMARRLLGVGLRSPKDPRCGYDFAGTVEAAGAAVTRYRCGDHVFGIARGAFAEYVCATEERLVLKPITVTFEAAAVVPVAALTALQAIQHEARVRAGQHVLINGAGGGVGSFAVQIAKALGAEVTAVCSTSNQETALSIGADHVVDYTHEDFTMSGRRYDALIAANGYHSIFAYRRSLKPNGIYVALGGAMKQMIEAVLFGPFLSRSGKKLRGLMAKPRQNDLVALKALLDTGKIVPVIDRRYPLADVPEAIEYLLGGHARGKVAISV